MSRKHRLTSVVLVVLAVLAGALPARAQAPLRKIGEMELSLLGVSATVDPPNPVVPKNVASGLRIVVWAGAGELSGADLERFLGRGYSVQAWLSGPGLNGIVELPRLGDPPPSDPLLLPLPALSVAGDYTLSNLRIVTDGRTALEVVPQTLTLKVIDQILVTSVKTRPLTLDEIREKGIVLDSDDYLGFEFTLGLKLESTPVNFSFPVVFDRKGVPVPQPLAPPPAPQRPGLSFTSPVIVPVMLEAGGDGGSGPRVPLTLPNGEPIRIPSILVIPGNVGYLKQFFSAQLFVANGAPVGSALTVRDVTGTIRLPGGQDGVLGTEDDPLSLAETQSGVHETLPIRALGPDGAPGTDDDQAALRPAEQGQAEFLIRGDKEGFHPIGFDIKAVLEGLPVGPVSVTGKANGGVLVRNACLNTSFTVPSVMRADEEFSVFLTLTNVGQGAANALRVAFDAGAMSGAELVNEPDPPETIAPGEAATLEYRFRSEVTGQVVASYLGFDAQTCGEGTVRFALGVGERGVALSPDTLVLPTAVDSLPPAVVRAAMRVLGQAWSIANAPSGTLPRGVIRTSKAVVTQKALALAEAGLRVSLGQSVPDAVRDLILDFFGGNPVDLGFDQLLRETNAGRGLTRAFGVALAESASAGVVDYERAVAEVAASGPDFITFSVGQGGAAAPMHVALVDSRGRRTEGERSLTEAAPAQVPGAIVIPLGGSRPAPALGVVSAPSGAYVLELTGQGDAGSTADVSVTLPRGDGTFMRGSLADIPSTSGRRYRIVLDLARPDSLVLEEAQGTGFSAVGPLDVEVLRSQGPQLVSANVIGPETLDGASPFGVYTAFLFDRVVDASSAATKSHYQIPRNAVQAAKRQLSGRLVFAALEQPEGPYIPTTVTVSGVTDTRGAAGPTLTVPLGSRIEDEGAVVSGRVLNADGTPVDAGIVTYAANVVWWDCGNATLKGISAVPLEVGRYEFRYVRKDNCGGPWHMQTRDPASGALRQVTGHVRAAGEQILADIVLFGRGSVTGVVRDQAGVPVPGADVAVFSVTDPQIGARGVADGDGRYLVGDITVGAVNVKAGKGAFLGQAAGRIDRAGTTASVDVTLSGTSVRVSGTVFRSEGGASSPAAGAQVLYRLLGFQNGQSTSTLVGVAQTGPNGAYVFDAVPSGAFSIFAALNSRDVATVTGQAATDLANVNLVIEVPHDLATLRGTVLFPDGRPAADVIVTQQSRGVLTGVDGTFALPGVPIDPLRSVMLTAQTRDGLRTGQASVNVNGPEVGGVVITLSRIGTAVFQVVSVSGTPVAGQEVALLGHCTNPCGCRTALSDPQGLVRFDNLPIGGASAQAVLAGAGFVDAARGSTSAVESSEPPVGLLRFGGVGTVSGQVVDPAGKPVFGAEVTLSSRRFTNDGVFVCGLVYQVSHRGRTDEEGRFRFTGVNTGPVAVTASHFVYTTQVGAKGSLTKDGEELSFTLKLVNTLAGVLSGTVTLPDGETPAGAGVEVTASGPLPDIKVKTDAGGQFHFPKILPAGTYRVTASDPVTGGTTFETIVLAVGQDVTHDLRLKGKGTVRVRVVDGADQPVPTALVRLTETAFPNRTFEGSVEPANLGVVTFDNVFEGPVSVAASDSFARGGRASTVLPKPGDTVEVKVRLTVTGRVSGRFLMPDGSTPIPYGTVKLASAGRVIGQVTTGGGGDSLGRFSFDYVPAGAVRLEAQDPLTGRTGVGVATLESEGQELLLDIKAQALGSVRGVVTLNGQSQLGAHVDIVSGTYKACTITGPDGYFVDGVPEGRVVATAGLNERGFLAGTASANLAGEGSEIALDVALRDAVEVTGRVLAAGGGDPGGPAVVTVRLGGVGGGTQTVATDASGGYRFETVPEGRAELTADLAGSLDRGATTQELVAPGPVDVPIALNGIGTVAVTFTGVEGVDNPSARRLTLSGTGPFPYGFTVNVAGLTGYRFPNVLAGPVTVSLSTTSLTGKLLYGKAAGTLAPGEELSVQVALEPTGTVSGRVQRGDGSPAVGAEIVLDLQSRGKVTLQAGADGGFVARGIPVTSFTLRASDPVFGGLAALRDQKVVDGAELSLGTIVLDAAPPTIDFVEPPDGATRAPLQGPLVFAVADQGSGLDLSSFRVVYPNGGAQNGASFSFQDGRLTGAFSSSTVAGQNKLRVEIKDLAGNLVQRTLSVTLLGATIRGHVRQADGTPAPGAQVRVDSLTPVATDADGAYAQGGLRAGNHSISATDPATGLTAFAIASVADGGEALEELALPAFGAVSGVVRRPGGAPVAGATVTSGSRSTSTDASGVYRMAYLPVGQYAFTATTAEGDKGLTGAVTVVSGQTQTADIVLNGLGSVAVTVRSAAGDLVAGASVTVKSSSPFAVLKSGTAAADGTVFFANVLAGSLTITATDALGIEGQTSAALADGQALGVTVTLEPAGTISGTVFHASGAGPASGVQVQLTGPKSATTTSDAAGRFSFANVPFGAFTLTATEGGTGDKGKTTGVLNGESAVADITLNGVGSVRVVVKDSFDALVAGAKVTLTSANPFGGTYAGTTGADGSAVFPNVLAGTITATASLPSNNTSGKATGTLAPGGSLELAATLQAVGFVRGRVMAPNGFDPVAGTAVTITGPSTYRTVTTGADGGFAFEDVPLGTHTLDARVNGRLRARVTDVKLLANGDEVARDLVLVSAGTVTGLISDPANAPAPGTSVTVTSPVALYGGAFSATTGSDGRYTIGGVPVGSFTLSATRVALGQGADGSGSVAADGQTVTVNLKLLDSFVTLPQDLKDGNTINWHVVSDGTISNGFPGVNFSGGAPRLSLVQGGTPVVFVGSGTKVASEEAHRELVLRQSGLAGLDVARKMYVPVDGYFIRYVDVLENPGPDPVTVDVLEETGFGATTWTPSVIETASGDAALGPEDSWAVLDDTQTQDLYENPSQSAPLAVAFSGPGGQAPSALTHEKSSSLNRLSYRWNAVTVPAGGSVAFLHVMSVQADRARARASAVRLAQLPPELLAGMSPQEASAVRNFSVPADLLSALPPLPANDGTISGRALAFDGVTTPGYPCCTLGITGTFRSRSPYFGRPLGISVVAADGSWSLTANPTPGAVRLLPREAFDLTFTEYYQKPTATASGDLVAGTASVDVFFRDTGVIEGRVLRSDGTPLTAGTVRLNLANGPEMYRTPDATGYFRYFVVLPGSYSLTHTDFSKDLTQTVGGIVVDKNQKVLQDIVYPAFGALQGTLRSAIGVAVNGSVTLTAPGYSRTLGVTASAGGTYLFEDVRPGTYTVTATESRSGAVLTTSVDVPAGPAVSLNFTFPPVGTVQVTATVGGQPLAGALVYWRSDSRGVGSAYVFAGNTDALGRFTIANKVPGPTAEVKVQYPNVASSFGTAPVAITSEGQTVAVTVAVPGVGTVTGTVRSRDGVAYPAVNNVSALRLTDGTILASKTPDAATGKFSLTSVPVEPFRLRGTFTLGFFNIGKADVTGALTSHGETLALDALIPCGAISTQDQRDLWEFDAAAGESVTLYLAGRQDGPAAPLSDPYLEVFGPSGALVASNDNVSASDKNSQITLAAAASGTYVASARAAGVQTGGYCLGTIGPGTRVYRLYAGATVKGRVTREADGQPAAGETLRLTATGTGVPSIVTTTRTAADGSYAFTSVPPGAMLVQLLDGSGTVLTEASGNVATGETLDLALVRPGLGQVTVEARRTNGVVLAGLSVTLTSDNAFAVSALKTRTGTTGSDGRVGFATIPAGTIVAQAADPTTGTPLESSGTLADGGALTLSLAFPVTTGTLDGVVLDEGLGVGFARVQVTDASGAVVTSPTADPTGAFRLELLPGTYDVWAFHPSSNRPGRTRASVAIGATTSVAVTLTSAAETGTINITGVREGSGLPAGGAVVDVYSEAFYPQWKATVTLDAQGKGTASGVPSGTVVVTSGAPPDLGWEDGWLNGSGSLDVVLPIGSRVWLPADLTGADGRTFLADDWGGSRGANGSVAGPYAAINDGDYAGRRAALVLQGGREVSNGPRTMADLRVTRRSFVPAGGRFERILDVIENPTGAPITVQYALERFLASDRTWALTADSSGDNAWELADDYSVFTSSAAADPEVAFVLGGPGAATRHDLFERFSPVWSFQGWGSLTVEPGQKVIVMTFLVQADHGDVSAAASQAEALRSLADPDALSGLTAEERGRIINFAVPAVGP